MHPYTIQSLVFTGVTVNPSDTGSTDTFIVNADLVTISTTLDSTYNSDIHFDYTVADKYGNTDSGVLTIKFVDTIIDIVAKPYTFTNDFFIPFSIVHEGQIAPFLLTALFVTENPNHLPDVIDEIVLTSGVGNLSGTLTFTANNPNPGEPGYLERLFTNFVYTPASNFIGTKTFPYTATFRGMTSSSVFHFAIPQPVCAASLARGGSFGSIAVGETSDAHFINIHNHGNIDANAHMSGKSWKSVADGTDVMNVGQTKYTISLEPTSYDDKIELTSAPIILRHRIVGPADSFIPFIGLQVSVDLLDNSFRGKTTQELTATIDCTPYLDLLGLSAQ